MRSGHDPIFRGAIAARRLSLEIWTSSRSDRSATSPLLGALKFYRVGIEVDAFCEQRCVTRAGRVLPAAGDPRENAVGPCF